MMVNSVRDDGKASKMMIRGAFKKCPDVEKVQVKYVHFKYTINNVSKIPTFGEFCLYNLQN